MICATASAGAHDTPTASNVSEPAATAGRNEADNFEMANFTQRTLRSVTVAGPAGKLEGLLNEGAADAAYAALVCHPHPMGGGTMHNKVVYHTMQVMNRAEWGFQMPVLRFNFRGVGLSEGWHDGTAESEDVLAATDWLESEYGRPIVVAGFSFGAVMALKACCGETMVPDKRVRAIAALGLPVEGSGRSYRYSFLKTANLPKLFLSGGSDEFARPEQLDSIVAHAAGPKKLIFIPGADHFFTQQLSAMQEALAGWLKELSA